MFFVASSPSVSASEKQTDKIAAVNTALATQIGDVEDPLSVEPPKPPEPPKPVEHIVATTETLSKIATAHSTTWQRLYAKNIGIQNPDVINAGDKIIIPLAKEVLPDRALPAAPPAPVAAAPKNAKPPQQARAPAAKASIPRGGSSGNTYAPGYCTWYAKQRRPDLPNNLGNANTWVARAAAQGIPTGSAPRAGAIGQQGMYVVYVESVNANGTINISEMNARGLGVISSRTASASSFMYIY